MTDKLYEPDPCILSHDSFSIGEEILSADSARFRVTALDAKGSESNSQYIEIAVEEAAPPNYSHPFQKGNVLLIKSVIPHHQANGFWWQLDDPHHWYNIQRDPETGIKKLVHYR